MTKIIGISGRKQSGKNTTANCICGKVFKEKGLVKDFYVSDDGKLIVQTTDSNNKLGWGELDLVRHDQAFVEFAENMIWPYAKVYHFADYLKKICVDLFDLSPSQVYGNDTDKNTMTQYEMTAREFLQYFGTDVMRKIKDTIWVDYTLKNIIQEQSEIAIIPDVRFPNEVEAIKKSGGYLIRLTRNVHGSDHPCETALDKENFDWDNFDHIIYNESCDIKGLNDMVQKLVDKII